MVNFCWHTWSSWSRAYEGFDSYNKTQYSKCKKCNVMKSRKFRTDQCISSDDINTATSQPDVQGDTK